MPLPRCHTSLPVMDLAFLGEAEGDPRSRGDPKGEWVPLVRGDDASAACLSIVTSRFSMFRMLLGVVDKSGNPGSSVTSSDSSGFMMFSNAFKVFLFLLFPTSSSSNGGDGKRRLEGRFSLRAIAKGGRGRGGAGGGEPIDRGRLSSPLLWGFARRGLFAFCKGRTERDRILR